MKEFVNAMKFWTSIWFEKDIDVLIAYRDFTDNNLTERYRQTFWVKLAYWAIMFRLRKAIKSQYK